MQEHLIRYVIIEHGALAARPDTAFAVNAIARISSASSMTATPTVSATSSVSAAPSISTVLPIHAIPFDPSCRDPPPANAADTRRSSCALPLWWREGFGEG